jgi:hypothetical protein
MDLFSLVAKLTLDSKDYERDIANLERQSIEVGDVKIGVDTSDFDSAVSDIDNTSIDDLEAAATLDTQNFTQGVTDISTKSDEFSKSVGGMFSELDGVLAGLGIVALITTIFNFMQKCINLTSDYADAVDKGSGALGMSYKQYQIWDYALGQSGGNVNELNRGMILFHKTMGATDDQIQQMVTDSGEMSEEMEEAAESAGASSDKLKEFLSGRGIDVSKIESAEELMKATLLEIAEISDETERKNLVTEFFGKNATGVLNLVKDGREEVEKLFERPVELGLIMSDQSIKNGVAYGDAVDDLNHELDALKQTFVEDILPILTSAVEKITAILTFFNGRAGGNSLAKQFEGIDDDFHSDLLQIEATSVMAGTMWDKLLAMGDYTSLNADQQKVWRETAQWLIDNIPSLGEVIDVETGQIKGNTEQVRDNIKAWRELSTEKALQNARQKKMDALAAKNDELVEARIELTKAESEETGKFANTISEANALLEKDAGKRAAFSRMFGKESISAEDENALAMTRWLYDETYSGWGASQEAKNFKTSYSEFMDAGHNIDTARQKVADLEVEVEQGQKDFETWWDAAQKTFEYLFDDGDEIIKVFKDINEELGKLPEVVRIKLIREGDIDEPRNPGSVRMFKQAKGDWIVPYDDYPSLLHRGEMVLTASQARQLRGGGGGEIDYTHLGQVVADAIRSGMDGVTVDSYLDGRLITEAVSREMAAQMSARRFG